MITDFLKSLTKYQQIVFIPNHGNVGDVIIAEAEYQLFDKFGIKYTTCTIADLNKIQNLHVVVYGGGGIFIENYAKYANSLVDSLVNDKLAEKIIILPSSFYQCDFLLDRFDNRFIVFCRDMNSYEYAKSIRPDVDFRFEPDIAFNLDINFNKEYVDMHKCTDSKLLKLRQCFALEHNLNILLAMRQDDEKVSSALQNAKDNFDISNLQFFSQYDMINRDIVSNVAFEFINFIDKFEIVATNRLHIALVAYALHKKIELYNNSYCKPFDVMKSSGLCIDNVVFKEHFQIPSSFIQTSAIDQFLLSLNTHKNRNFIQLDVNDLFKHAFQIQIDKAKQVELEARFAKCKLLIPQLVNGVIAKSDELAKYIEPKFIEQFKNKKNFNTLGTSASFIKIIRHAKDNDLPFVLVFEDDALSLVNCMHEIQQELNFIPDDCDVFLLGYSSIHGRLCINREKRIYKISKDGMFTGTHAIIIFKRAYDTWLETSKNVRVEADVVPCVSKMNIYVARFPLFIQATYSDSVYVQHTQKIGKLLLFTNSLGVNDKHIIMKKLHEIWPEMLV